MSTPKSNTTGRYIIAALVLLLIILHQDNWNWQNTNLVFGFLPVALFYHICISIGAASVWFLATKIAWPADLEEETLAEISESSHEGSAP